MNISVTNNQLHVAMNDWNVIDIFKSMSLEDICKVQKQNALPYAVGAINLTGGLNLGNMIRSAVIFGAQKFYVIGKKRYDRRSAVGAHNYIDIEYIEKDVNNEEDQKEIVDIISNNYNPVFVEQGGTDIQVEDYAYQTPCCFMFGEEGTGVPIKMIENSVQNNNAKVVSIAQVGVLRSLNVSSAAAIVMWKVAMDLRQTPRSWR